MNDIIKFIKSLEDSNVLIDGITELVKDETKKTRRWISSCFVCNFGCFISVTSEFFSSKRYKWKRKWKDKDTLKTNMSSLKFRLINIFFIKCYSVGFTSSVLG